MLSDVLRVMLKAKNGDASIRHRRCTPSKKTRANQWPPNNFLCSYFFSFDRPCLPSFDADTARQRCCTDSCSPKSRRTSASLCAMEPPFSRNKRLKASFVASMWGSEYPRLDIATTLTARTSAGVPSTIMYGGTSLVILANPPTYEQRPIAEN